jgi:glycyl-tRNA synthetase beta chain
MPKNLLFEIGTEELPAKSFPNVLNQMRELAEKLFNENRIVYKTIETYATPRRLVLSVKNVNEYQEDLDELIRGPQRKIAFDELGNLTKSGIGFLKNNNLKENDIFIDIVNGIEYVYARKTYAGNNATKLLETILPQIIHSITFSKSMRWGTYNLKFSRPIRWIMAILGNEIIKFTIENLSSENKTKGHRTLSNNDIIVNCADDYFKTLKDNYVIVDQNERSQIIKTQINQIASTLNATALIDEDLLHEVIYIVEYPTAIIGDFEPEFLKLPKEVITTPMIEHQRYFPLINSNGKLLPHFIVIRNGSAKHAGSVRRGNERVLRARLSDAKFFFDEDLKEPLSNKVSKLKDIVYQEKLGTVYEKVERIEKIVEYIAGKNNFTYENLELLKRAVFLSKADLVTNMVGEFDELQGIMGKEYAIRNGEKKEVAEAIFSHYLPRFSSDDTPGDVIGQIIAIADKTDTVIGFFAIGLHPTGSQDPYGLRRQTIGLINIIMSSNLSINLDEIITLACNLYKDRIIINEKQLRDEINNFLKQRLKVILTDKGYKSDVIDAVSQKNIEYIDVLNSKVVEISEALRNNVAFKNFIIAFNRVTNLVSLATKNEIDIELLMDQFELKLYNEIRITSKNLQDAIAKDLFSDAISIVSSLTQFINDFLDNAKILVEDLNVRANRLALLKFVHCSCSELCDFSKLKLSE